MSKHALRLPIATICFVLCVAIQGEAQSLPSECTNFTDYIVGEGTTIRAVHITELRACINALRSQHSLTAVTWTDSVLQGATIKAIHITELRSALDAVYSESGATPPSYTDTLTATVTVIRAVHLTQLRTSAQSAPSADDDECSYQVSPTNTTVGSGNGTLEVFVSASDDCEWDAEEHDNFLDVQGSNEGEGDGSVVYSIENNTSAEQRSATVTVAGHSVDVVQLGVGSSEPDRWFEIETEFITPTFGTLQLKPAPGSSSQGNLVKNLLCGTTAGPAVTIGIYVNGVLIEQGSFSGAAQSSVAVQIRASSLDRTGTCRYYYPTQNRTFNDPFTIRGAGPETISIWINSFIPDEWVTNPWNPNRVFDGDGRTFGQLGSSRTTQGVALRNPALFNNLLPDTPYRATGLTVEFDWDTTQEAGWSAALADWVWEWPLKTRWEYASTSSMSCGAAPLAPEDEQSVARISCQGSASDPLVLAPAVDWNITIDLRFGLGENQIGYSISGCHDGFPSYEILLFEKLIYTHSATGGPLAMLGSCDTTIGAP